MSSPAPSELERLLRGVEIPPCPAILTRLQKEIASPNASLSAVGTLISSDVALAGSVLKVANSAAFGLSRKVTTIQQALPVLGMRTLGNLLAGVALRNALGNHHRLDRLWDSPAHRPPVQPPHQGIPRRAAADWHSRNAVAAGKKPLTVKDVLTAMIKAHEIQGCYGLLNSINRVGQDHVILVRLASTAVATAMLGGGKEQIVTAVSHSWIDNGALRTYRHAPNTGPRKRWAAGDACRRAVTHAINAVYRGVVGYPSALSAKTWGFYDVAFKGKPFEFERPFGSYVMENVLFKISFPAEFHAQTAVECALKLHPLVSGKLDRIARISIETQEAGVRIIDKTGPLANPADRDHCIQYMVAVPLVHGRLTAADYEDEVARDPRIDALRDKMEVLENPQFTRDYFDPDKRYIGNAVQVHFASQQEFQKKNGPFDENFAEVISEEINFRIAVTKLNYPRYYASLSADDNLILSDTYDSFLQNLEIDADDNLMLPSYKTFVLLLRDFKINNDDK